MERLENEGEFHGIRDVYQAAFPARANHDVADVAAVGDMLGIQRRTLSGRPFDHQFARFDPPAAAPEPPSPRAVAHRPHPGHPPHTSPRGTASATDSGCDALGTS